MAGHSIDQQVEILMQGTDYGDEQLKQAMEDELRTRLKEAEKEGRPLKVYCGFDPRKADLHLGHTVPMRKMRQFQELGHEVTFVIGRFTSLVGDPSDKDKVRAQISIAEATANAETYAEQAIAILDPAKTRFEYNDTWLSKITFAELIELASLFTIQQFLARETFRKRFNNSDPIYVHEFFYAIMQGFDAFHLGTDVQIGGSDQLFNIVTAARKLMEVKGIKPNIAIIHGILPGTDGEVKMSKSLGNHIPLTAAPEDMFGKVMSVPDKAMESYFRLLTRWSPAEIESIVEGLQKDKLNPRDVKMQLAHEIVSIYHGENKAESAEAHFRQVFQRRKPPDEMPEYHTQSDKGLVDVLVESKLASSRSEARRLISQRGVRLEEQVLEDPLKPVVVNEPQVLRVGKRRFLRLLPPKE